MADINNSDPETKKQPPGNYFDQTMRVELNDTPIIDCTSSHHGPTQPKHWRERERERERESIFNQRDLHVHSKLYIKVYMNPV